jgi:3-methyl-2-oxobutanoate hydroxymethyltransferase
MPLPLNPQELLPLVLEGIPADLAGKITAKLQIPTIGIGAGPDCDGQVLVTHDLLGLNEQRAPMKFTKEYVALREIIQNAVQQYVREVREGLFPAEEHSYGSPLSVSSTTKQS